MTKQITLNEAESYVNGKMAEFGYEAWEVLGVGSPEDGLVMVRIAYFESEEWKSGVWAVWLESNGKPYGEW